MFSRRRSRGSDAKGEVAGAVSMDLEEEEG